MHDFPHFAGFDDDADGRPQAGGRQRAVDGGDGQQRRHGQFVVRQRLVAEDEHALAVTGGLDGLLLQFMKGGFQIILPANGQRLDLDMRHFHDEQAGQIAAGENRAGQADDAGAVVFLRKDVALVADIRRQAHDQLFADRIDRRVGHLREALLEVVEQQLRTR